MLVMTQVVSNSSISSITSGRIITFQEWTPDVDTSWPPVAMLINSSELRVTGFNVKEVLPPALETDARGGMRTRYHLYTREDRDCEVLRVWVLKGLFCQWMTTLNSGHDVSE